MPVYVQVRIKRATPEASRKRFYLFSAVVRLFCLFTFVLFAAKYVFLKFLFGHGDGTGDGLWQRATRRQRLQLQRGGRGW